MRVYVDTSVLMRLVLSEAQPLAEFGKITHAATSEITKVEALRTLDRFRLRSGLEEKDYVHRVELTLRLLSGIELIRLSPPILERASQPFPVQLNTLDAVHLSSCLLYRERLAPDVILASHDEGLRLAARAMGLATLG